MTRNLTLPKGPRKASKLLNRTRPKTDVRSRRKTRAIDDVYEYAPSKVRRAKVALSLDRHEIGGRQYGSDDEVDLTGLGQDAMQKLRAKLMRDDEDEDGGGVDSEDDEDIDSEDAFEESDKDEFAGSGFVRKGGKIGPRDGGLKRKGRIIKDVDLNEDSDAQSERSQSVSGNEEEEEEMDGEGSGEFFDALDIFDGRADVENDDPPRQAEKKRHAGSGGVRDEEGVQDDDVGMSEDEPEEEDGDEEEDGEEEDDELRISASDSEESSPEALADLENFISNLDPTAPSKRKPDEVAEPESRKRRRITDRTEAGEENEFGVRGSSTLKLDDLLASLASSDSLAALKKSTKLLTSSSVKTKTLSAPLPQRAQERLDREAAYEQTKEEVEKWSATMKRIKEAEHLSFPLQAEKPGRVSNLELAARFTPSNELESAVDKLLKSAQLRDEDIEHTEALKMAHLSVEEVAARRAELRMMRELAFRADKKAKRVAKIKSKTYRRIRKKQRERLDGPDEDGEDSEDEEARMKAEVQRAQERATLRHKTTGKWAKAMKGREGLDQDQRQAIGEMLERGEKLRRRIRGEDSDDDGSGGGESESEEDERDEDAIKRGAFDELTALRAEDDSALPDLKSKSVFNMKFMREAAARRAREANEQAEELQKEMTFGIDGGDGGEDGLGAVGAVPTKDATVVQRTGGRLSFQPGSMPGTLKSLGSLASDTSSITLQSADLPQEMSAAEPTTTSNLSTPTLAPAPTTIVNPWLAPTSASGPSRKRNEVRVHKDADTLAKASNKLRKQSGKHAEERERAKDDAVVEIDANQVLTITEPALPTQSTSGKKRKEKVKEGVAKTSAGAMNVTQDKGEGDDESDVASEVEEQERIREGTDAGKIRAFQQRELVALAFAGDNVVQAFEEAKRQETEADAPCEVDTTLPGWGAWGGTGTKKLPSRPHLIKTIPGIVPTARADHAKPHLILSEKRDKKASKYLVRELPHPYTSHAQFERLMEVPIGSEWNTRVGFQRGTMPRVVKKMGTVIDPLEKLF